MAKAAVAVDDVEVGAPGTDLVPMKDGVISPKFKAKAEEFAGKAIKARRDVHVRVLILGKYLWEIDRGRYYIALGHATMTDWLKSNGFEPSRARRQMLMYEHCVHRTELDLETVAEYDTDLLYAARADLTKAKAPRVLADLDKVKAGKMEKVAFLEKHKGSAAAAREPTGAPPGHEAHGEADDFQRPASERSKVDEALEWTAAFTPVQIDEFLGKLAAQQGRSSAFTHQHAITLIANMPFEEITEFMRGFVEHERFKSSQKGLGSMLATVAKHLDIRGLTSLAEGLDALMVAASPAKGGAKKG